MIVAQLHEYNKNHWTVHLKKNTPTFGELLFYTLYCSVPLTGPYLFPRLPALVSGCGMSTDVHFHLKKELIKITLLEFTDLPDLCLFTTYCLLVSVSNAQRGSILQEGHNGFPPWLRTGITCGTLKTNDASVPPLEILFKWHRLPLWHLNFLKAPQGLNTHTHTHTLTEF